MFASFIVGIVVIHFHFANSYASFCSFVKELSEGLRISCHSEDLSEESIGVLLSKSSTASRSPSFIKEEASSPLDKEGSGEI
jgi:hypothetical protein